MRIIAVRHGETEENRVHTLSGHLHGTLSAKGQAQAKKLAHQLRNVKIDAIFSSDLGRAAETIKGVAKEHGLPVVHTKALRDQDYGIFQGRSWHLFFEAQTASGLGPAFRPQKGESFVAVARRVKRFTKQLSVKYAGKTVLLSTHAGVIRCLLSIYLNVPLEHALKTRPKNTGIVVLEVGRKGVTLATGNSLSHPGKKRKTVAK